MKDKKSKNRRTLRTICLLLFATLSFTVHAQITVHLQDLPLRTSLKKIEQVSSYRFFWNENLPELNQKVSLDVKNATIDQTMKQLLGKMELTYRQDKDNVIVLMRKESGKPATKTVTGTVVDANGEPIIGASVVVKGSPTGTITDMNGRFTLTDVPEKATLTVSYVGYKAIDMAATGGVLGKVVLHEDSKMIDEVVVVGYGSMRKSDFTGSLANVKANELSLSAPTAGQALIGKVAGVQVTMPSGAPGQGAKIRIRGVNSLSASSAPLYVVDGYPASEDVYINPEDIESIDVLKDAASAAIYGSRGASGVVLITTKRGATGKVRVDYDYQFSVQQLERKVKMLDAWQYRDLVIEARNNSYKDKAEATGKPWSLLDDNAVRVANGFSLSEVGIAPIFFDFTTGKPVEPAYNTDWQDALYSNAPMQRHNLSISGGKEELKYRISVGYMDQDGIIDPSNHKQLNVRTNIDAQATSRLKIGVNFSFSNVNDRMVQAKGRFINDGVVQAALMSYPQFPVYNPDGSYAVGNQIAMKADGYAQVENPVALAHEIDIRQQETRMNFNTNLSFEIIKGLFANANLGTQYTTRRYNYYRPRTVGQDGDMPNSAGAAARVLATDITTYDIDQLGEFTFNYKKEFGKHKVDALAGYTLQKKTYDRVAVDTKNFSDDRVHEITAHGPNPSDVSLHGSDTRKAAWTMMSYLGRINYNYSNKYAASATIRTDGSSRFGPNNKWGVFPSVSLGWTVSNEPFYINTFGESSSIKLRASWGLSGNNNIGNYEVYSVMSKGGYPFGNNVETAYWQGGFKDQSIGWEKTSQYNVGLDLSFLNRRINLIGNYYYSLSYDLLYNQPISAISGSTSVTTNLTNAKVRNTGLDLQLDARIIDGHFKWNTSANISVNRNKVLDMGGINDIYMISERNVVTHVTKSGLPIGSFYGYSAAGIISEADYANILTDKAIWINNGNKLPDGYVPAGPAVPNYNDVHAGDVKWLDVDGNGRITEDDRHVLGNAYPDFTYGISTDFSYKGFDLRATFVGSQGAEVINFQKYYLFGMDSFSNQLVSTLDRWHSDAEPGRNNVHRASRAPTPNISTRLSSYMVDDASYFRCANITLGYNFPVKVLKKIGIQSLRLYVSGDNLFTLTKYEGYNPDVDYKGNNLLPGFDWGVYPLSRNYSVGLKVTL